MSESRNGNKEPDNADFEQFIENRQVLGSISSYAASVGGDPGPQVGALFGHRTRDGGACRDTNGKEELV